LFYTAILNFVASSATGSLFRVHALFLLLGFVVFEFAFVAIIRDDVAWGWAILNLVDVQFGYLIGICARKALEHLGYSVPVARSERPR
jgi:hypothetical protein